MAGKLQRCYNCSPLGREFEGDKPECDKCGAAFPAVLTLTLVHWLLPTGPIRGTFGTFRVACQEGRPNLAGPPKVGFPATTESSAVSCPLCKKADGFEAALAAHRERNEE